MFCALLAHCRSLDICAHLSAQLGCEVAPGDVRIAIACVEQDNCSVKYKCVWDSIQENIIPDMPVSDTPGGWRCCSKPDLLR